MKRRSVSILLLVTVMMWMVPLPLAQAATPDSIDTAAVTSTQGAPGNSDADSADDAAVTDGVNAASDEAPAADGQVVVLYENGELPDKIAELSDSKANKAQQKVLDAVVDGDFTVEDTIVLESEDEDSDDMVVGIVSSDAMDTGSMVEALEDSDKIRYAEPNYKFTASDIPDWSDVYARDSWQVGDRGVNADDVSGFTDGGSSGGDVVIAVMDTGIDYNHNDLKDRMWTEPDGYPLKNKKKHGVDLVTNDRNPMDENGHGTHCAGIIAAAADNSEGVIGVAGKRSDIRLMAVRILDADGSGYLESIVTGFRHLIRAKKAGVNIKAVNCSFGASVTSDIFDEVVEQAGQAGILTVAAAGNECEDNDVTPSSPANCKSDYVISVASTDYDGSLSSYSNYGRKMVDVAAPGSNILSSVSYDSYTPYLYDAARLSATTDVYGEFTDVSVEKDENGNDFVRSVLGTDYNGNAISEADGVTGFGASRMLANLTKKSSGSMSLDVSSGGRSFNIGNNTDTLSWNIRDARAGDEYILYFPYDKQVCDYRDTIYANAVFKAYTDEENGGMGEIAVGDVIVDAVGKNGKVAWSIANLDMDDEEVLAVPVSYDWNSIWHASGEPDVFYQYKDIKGIDNESEDGTGYGFGLVYTAVTDGDVRVDISSLAISQVNPEVEEFGKYDVYSGTSMATPVVTGAVALIAAMNPGMSADDIRATLFATTTDSKDSDKWSTRGNVDFSNYNPTEDTSRPAVRSVVADFDARKVTIKGRGFGSSPRVEIHNNVTDAEGHWTAVPCTASSGSIVIDDSDALGIIGSDITFKITNASGKDGYASKYVVKGIKGYDDAYEIALQSDLVFFDFSKALEKYKVSKDSQNAGDVKEAKDNEEDKDSITNEGGNGDKKAQTYINKSPRKRDDEEIWEDMPADPVMPAGLNYIPGANEILKYASDGAIHSVSYNEETKVWEVLQRGTDLRSFLLEYAKQQAESNEFWSPDIEGFDGFLNFELLGNPAYLGEVVYELVRVTLDGDRDAVLLVGLDLNGGNDKWRVYYDSVSGVGSKPASLDFNRYDKTALAGYNGKIYMIGGSKVDIDDDIDWMDVLFGSASPEDAVSAVPYREVYSYEPSAGGSAWTQEASLPSARMLGTAVAQNGNLYYMLSNESVDTVDYSVYKYDGSAWSRVGSLNKAIFTGYNAQLADVQLDMFMVGVAGVGIPCAIGVDNSGIVFGGMSFDRSGDTFRFNTKTNKVESLPYSLWGDIADRDVNGGAVGDKFYAEYLNEFTEKTIAKTIPIESNYVRLEKTVEGEGSGTVIGGGYYTRGEKTRVTITPDEGSFIYNVESTGTSPALNKSYSRPTAKSKKTHATTYNATKDGSLNVYFGKLSTKVIMPKTKLTKAVGKREIEAYTDGTISEVKWKSSNKKYAKVNKDGTITFRKAGVGKTVKLTAVSVENPKLKATCKVRIKSRERRKFKWGRKKFTTRVKVMIDRRLGRKKTPKSFNATAKSGAKVRLSWKKVRGVSGYIVLRKTGNGRYVQIAKLSARRKAYTDKKVKAGRKYRYVVVSYKKVKGSKAVRISRSPKSRKVTARR